MVKGFISLLCLWVLAYGQDEPEPEIGCENDNDCPVGQECIFDVCYGGVDSCAPYCINASSEDCLECCEFMDIGCPGGNGTGPGGNETGGNGTEEECGTYQTCCASTASENCNGYCSYFCSECQGKGKTPCSTGLVCGSSDSCREAGRGVAGEPCGSTGDANCKATLSCRSTLGEKFCGGNGTLGAHCDDYINDASCSSNLVCDYSDIAMTTRTCRAKGNGAAGQPCTRIGYGDTACISPLVCGGEVGLCRNAGNGNNGANCGSAGDLPCSGVCDDITKKCRETGTGNANSNCGSSGDAACSSPQACDVLERKCRPAGDGNVGAKCGGDDGNYGSVVDATCSNVGLTAYVCDNDNYTCRVRGTGLVDEICKQSDDQNCNTVLQLTCDSVTKKCRLKGDGNHGAGCSGGSDSSCSGSLVCSAAGTCAGTGASGSHCGVTGDEPCGDGSVCDTVDKVCRPSGTGLTGEKCGTTGDAACTSGSCKDNKCVSGGGSAAHKIYVPSVLVALLFAFISL